MTACHFSRILLWQYRQLQTHLAHQKRQVQAERQRLIKMANVIPTVDLEGNVAQFKRSVFQTQTHKSRMTRQQKRLKQALHWQQKIEGQLEVIQILLK